MPADMFTLRRSGAAPVRFCGELIAESSGQHRANREYSRYHDLAIYRVEDGGYLLHVEYVTRYQGEVGYSLVLPLASQSELVRALEAYDPCSRVRGYPDGEQHRVKQQRLLEEIRSHYQEQVSDLLESCSFTEEISEMANASGVTSFRPDEDTREAISRLVDLHGHESASEAISLSVQGWEMALNLAQAEVESILDREEWNCLADVMNGALWTVQSGTRPGMIFAANVEDGHRLNGVGEKWFESSPDERIKALIGKLHALTYVQAWAVGSAIRWFWANSELQFDHQTEEWWTMKFRRGTVKKQQQTSKEKAK